MGNILTKNTGYDIPNLNGFDITDTFRKTQPDSPPPLPHELEARAGLPKLSLNREAATRSKSRFFSPGFRTRLTD